MKRTYKNRDNRIAKKPYLMYALGFNENPLHEALVKFTSRAMLLILLGGCQTTKWDGMPNPIFSIEDDLASNIEKAKKGVAESVYFKQTSDEKEKRLARDEFLFARISVINIEYLQRIKSLTTNEKLLNSATDLATLTLNIAGTLTGAARAKANLAAAATLFQGGRIVVDKDIYYDKSIDALVATMDARRKEKFAEILEGLGKDTTSYPLMLAAADLDEYAKHGTLQDAVNTVQSNATTKASAAQETIKNIMGDVPNLDKNHQDLKRALSNRLGRNDITREQANGALIALGIPEAATIESAKGALQHQIIIATPERLDSLKSAFAAANISLD